MKMSDLLPWRFTFNTTKGKLPLSRVVITNISASVLVAMISMCLSIGLGIASGSTPIAGLRAAIWGGLMGGSIGSSPFNIIGPAGALSSMLSSYSAQWGPDILPWISIFSGVICFVVVVLGLQKYCLLMPKSVFEGFTISVALTIGLKQINYAFGLKGLKTKPSFPETVADSIAHLDHAQWGSMVLFFPQTVALYLLMRFVPKVPWLVIIPLSTILLGYFFEDPSLGWDLPTLKTKFGQLPNTVAVGPSLDALKDCKDVGGLIVASASVAFVSVLETLISAKIAEFRVKDNELGPFSDTWEIRGLTCAQILSGALSGLPNTGVFVRTNANVQAGANHPISQFMNAAIVLFVTLVTMPIFSYMPLASVASLLVVSSIRMVPFGFLKCLWKETKAHFFLCLLVAVICTCYDATIGLLAGQLISYLMLAMKASFAPDVVSLLTKPLKQSALSNICELSFSGAITFANSEALVQRAVAAFDNLENKSDCKLVLFMMNRVTEADLDGAQALERLAVLLGRSLPNGVSDVYVVDLSDSIAKNMTASPWFIKCLAEGRVVQAADSAIADFMDKKKDQLALDVASKEGEEDFKALDNTKNVVKQFQTWDDEQNDEEKMDYFAEVEEPTGPGSDQSSSLAASLSVETAVIELQEKRGSERPSSSRTNATGFGRFDYKRHIS